ncbi:MAG: type II secretion system protein [Phycisphaerae bacterium]|nr:type II secretion system protein [Phycisphaerae bacterium]
MRRGRGFTLLEVMVVIAILGLLVSILVPAVQSARSAARLAVCQAGAKSLSAAIWFYAADFDCRFPPFSFSSVAQPDLLLSGHWGGSRNPADPDLFGRFPDEMAHVNLGMLVSTNYIPAGGLICPGADGALRDGTASFFPYSDQFSTYCLRFPPSEDLFRDARQLRTGVKGGPHVLAIYRFAAGGHWEYVSTGTGAGATRQMVPYVHSERTYRTSSGVFDPAQSALLADAFWMRDYEASPVGPGAKRVIRRLCHGDKYNVLFGHGGVETVEDDGTMQNLAAAEGASPDGQSPYYDQAEAIWEFLDRGN